MIRNIIFLFLFLGVITIVSANEGFFEGFGNFLDGIGDLVESFDFEPSHSSNKQYHHYYDDDDFLSTYFLIRAIDSLFTPQYSTIPTYNISLPTTLPVIILNRVIIIVSCVVLSFVVIFTLLDILKHRTFRGKRIFNMFMLWFMAIFICFGVFLVWHLLRLIWLGIIALWPYFWPFFLATASILFTSYAVLWTYKRSGFVLVHRRIC